MAIDKKMIEYLSDLSRLKLGDEEQEELIKDLNDLENMVSSIQKVNTEGISKKFSVIPPSSESKLRPDKLKESFSVGVSEKLAPQFKDGRFVVPQVIE